jgi:phage tail sheath protein FI
MHAAGGGVAAIRVESRFAGTEGNGFQVNVLPSTGGLPGTFDLAVLDTFGNQVEYFPDLSRSVTNQRFINSIINGNDGSNYIKTTNLDGTGTTTPDEHFYTLDGGTDGVASVPDADFIGDEADGTGLYALDEVQDLSILFVPGRTSSAIHNAMLSYCEVHRDGMVFAVLDAPRGMGAADVVTYVATTASLENASEYGAIYWPWLKILSPSQDVFDTAQIVVPPSGVVAGIMARTDTATPGGIYRQPAGTERGVMFGVLGFDTTDALKEAKRDLVYPHRINPLTTGAGLPRYVDGSRTLKGNGAFPSVAERRGVMFIERSLKRGLAFARHRNNTPELRAQVQRTITAFLLTQMRNGAFKSQDPATAFFVDVSDRLNPPSSVLAGKLVVRVGLATNKPAEFVILEISQDTRALEAELAGAGA